MGLTFPAGPHGKALGSVRRQKGLGRHAQEPLLGFPWQRMGEAREQP